MTLDQQAVDKLIEEWQEKKRKEEEELEADGMNYDRYIESEEL